MTEAKEIREYADLIQAEALRRKVSVLALLDQLEREEECYLAGWNECEEAIRKMASPESCDARGERFGGFPVMCTRPRGHEGVHLAGPTDYTWPNASPDVVDATGPADGDDS